MKCSPEFRKRVAEQAEIARRGSGRGYTGQMTFTYGEVKWILADLERLHAIEDYKKDGSEPTELNPTDQSLQHHQV